MKKTDQLTSEEIVAALKRAGVPKRYQKPKVGNIPIPRVEVWLNSTAETDVAAGKGFFIYDDKGAVGLDAFYLAARWLLLHGVSTGVFHLPHLADMLATEGGLAAVDEVVGDLTVVGLAGFYVDGYTAPLSEEMRYRMEWMFSRWMNNGKAMIFQSTKPSPQCKWWSDFFLAQVAENTMI